MIKKVYRDTDNKVLAGVLSGLANYYGHDPVLWRVGFIVLLFLTGVVPMAIAYLVAWIIIPPQPKTVDGNRIFDV